MSPLGNPPLRSLRTWLLLSLLLAVLAGCGDPEPTAVIKVITATFTPEPVVKVVTATFTPTPEVAPSDTPLPPEPSPSPTPLPSEPPPSPTPQATAAIQYVAYEHPSGAFGLDVPQDADLTEEEDGLIYFHGDSLVMVIYAVLDAQMDAETMEETIPTILDDAIVGQGLIESYENLELKSSEDEGAAAGSFDIQSEIFGAGEGGIILWQRGQTLYMQIFLTPDYEELGEVWQRAVDTLTFNPVQPTATLAPTITPVPPTSTPQPQPTNTTAPPPPPPPPQSNQGCYLFENHIDAELNVTFSAVDRNWSDSFKIDRLGTKEYCLDAGRYTYTIDAPPPWGSINGDLEVNAGDRFLWPIEGR